MAFLKEVVDIVRKMAPTHTALEMTMKLSMSTSTLYLILKENPDIKLKMGKRGRPKKNFLIKL